MQQWTEFFVGFAALLTAVGTVLAIVRKWISAAKKDMQIDLHTILASHGSRILRQIDGVDPTTYVVLDFDQGNGRKALALPIMYEHAVEPITGLFLTLEGRFEDRTEYQLSSRMHPVPVMIPFHSHSGNESIVVVKGTVRDVHTGVIYREGETWSIEPGKRHSAELHRALCIATMRPALPNGVQRPVDVTDISSVYDQPILASELP